MSTDNKALQLIKYILDKGIDGVGPLCSATELAREYIEDSSYTSTESRIDSLINWETSKNFTSGFVTGLGGLITLPITIPAAIGASWLIQARMAAAIAVIAGHDIKSDRVRTMVLMSLLGDSLKQVLKEVGVKVAGGFANAAFKKLPGTVLIEINKRVGFRLLTKAGQTGVVNLVKWIPVVGGVVGGTFDAVSCRIVGTAAKNAFLHKTEETPS